MNELEKLERQLRRRLVIEPAHEEQFRPLPAVSARLTAVRQALQPPRGHYSDSRIAQGIMAFRLAGAATRYPDLKYACYGVARPMDWEGRILLAEERLIDQLLSAVSAHKTHPRHFAACCKGLMAAWLGEIKGNHALFSAAHTRYGIEKLSQFLLEHAASQLKASRAEAAKASRA